MFRSRRQREAEAASMRVYLRGGWFIQSIGMNAVDEGGKE